MERDRAVRRAELIAVYRFIDFEVVDAGSSRVLDKEDEVWCRRGVDR